MKSILVAIGRGTATAPQLAAELGKAGTKYPYERVRAGIQRCIEYGLVEAEPQDYDPTKLRTKGIIPWNAFKSRAVGQGSNARQLTLTEAGIDKLYSFWR